MAGNSGWVDIEVKGLKELEAMLLKLPQKMAQRILYKAVLAGAAVVRREAKRLVVKRTGGLERAIRSKRVRTRRPGLAIYQVGARHPVAHLIEFGVAAHTIRPKRKKVLRISPGDYALDDFYGNLDAAMAGGGSSSSWGRFLGKEVKHPGFSAKPFLRPAFDNSTQAILAAMNKNLMKNIEKEAPYLFGKVGK